MPTLRLFDPDEAPMPNPGSARAVFVSDVVRLYLAHSVAERTHCPEARAERERVLGDFVFALGHLAVDACKPHHLTDWIEAHPRWHSVSTRRSRANYVRAAFNWALTGERIGRNPFASVRYAEADRRPDMPDDVLDRVAAASNKPFERALRFLRLTGCRLSELCAARWPDFDLDRGIWIIHRHKSRRFTGKPRCIALVPEAVDLLRTMAQTLARSTPSMFPGDAPPTDAVFANNRGTAWTRRTLGQQWLRVKRSLDIDTRASLHGIRHRFGSAAVANGAPVKLVSAQLGHSSQAVTERYYVDISQEIEAIRAAAALAIPK